MSLTVFLDSGPLGLLTNTNRTPTADPKELDGEALIAAQALDTGLQPADYIIATMNVGHLAQFAPADLWTNIKPSPPDP